VSDQPVPRPRRSRCRRRAARPYRDAPAALDSLC